MKFPLLHVTFWILFAAGFPMTSTFIQAETRCPGNVAGLRPRLVAGALLVVPVSINQSGPYDFMVDTGSQLNVIDPRLAAQLEVKSEGSVHLVATSTVLQASAVILDSLETGSHQLREAVAAVQDLGPIQAADPHIRGVLGENFLAHFDLLIDYPNKLLCLDEGGAMQGKLRGERIPLVHRHAADDVPFTDRLVVSVHLSGTGSRPILLQLDSGCDGAILYSGNTKLEEPLLKRAQPRGPDSSEAQRAFAVLPPQDMTLGSRLVRQVPFVTPASASHNVPNREEEGILATVLFHRVFISHSGHFIIFEPK